MVGKGVMGGACGLTPPPQAPCCLFAYETLAPQHFHASNLFFRLSQYTGKQQNMIENVLRETRRGVVSQDLGRVVVQERACACRDTATKCQCGALDPCAFGPELPKSQREKVSYSAFIGKEGEPAS